MTEPTSEVLLDGPGTWISAATVADSKTYSTSEVADFFGKSNQWVYWGMRNAVFIYPPDAPLVCGDTVVPQSSSNPRGSVVAVSSDKAAVKWGNEEPEWEDASSLRKLIEPHRIGKGRRRFTLPIIREIALSCLRRGNLKEDKLKEILRRIELSSRGLPW